MNFVNSNINQWTMLAAMIPIVFSLSRGQIIPVVFVPAHRAELVLTIAQSLLGGLCLLDRRLSFWQALGIFALWIIQFIRPGTRELVTVIYLVWSAVETARLTAGCFAYRRMPRAISGIRRKRG